MQSSLQIPNYQVLLVLPPHISKIHLFLLTFTPLVPESLIISHLVDLNLLRKATVTLFAFSPEDPPLCHQMIFQN